MIYDVEMDSHQPVSQTCFCFFTSSTLWWCHSPPVRWGMRRNFHVWLKFTTGVQHSRWSISTILDAKHFESHVPIETVTGAINSLMMSWPKMMPSTGESGGYIIGGIGLLQKILSIKSLACRLALPPFPLREIDSACTVPTHGIWGQQRTEANEENNNKRFSRSRSPDLYITVDISLPCSSAPQENLVGSYNINSSEETEYCLI